MAGIHIFAFLVGCAPNLIACEQISTYGLEWDTIPECQAEISGLVRKHSGDSYPVVMARCHYVMDSDSQTAWQLAGRINGRFYGF